MIRHKSPLRAALLSIAALFPVTGSQAQVVETVKEYTITIEEGGDPCENLTTVGHRCGPELDIVYVGHGVSGRKLYATEAPLAATAWNNGSSSRNVFRARMSGIRGAQSTAFLAGSDSSTLSGTQPHLAAQACQNLTHGGYDDWYMPAIGEAYHLFEARSHLQVNGSKIWTSTETDASHAHSFNVATAAVNSLEDKYRSYAVQCVRGATTPSATAVACDEVTATGGACGTGRIINVGEAPSGGALFTTAFGLPAVAWNADNASRTVMTNISDPIEGGANTSALASADASTLTGTQDHIAGSMCSEMSYGGYSDWHLPAVQEAVGIHRSRASLALSAGVIWTSTETDSDHAYSYDVATGAVNTFEDKWTNRMVRCVRKEAPPATTPEDCDGLDVIGETCAGGDIVYAGESVSGGLLFTTTFPLAALSWNQENASRTIRTGADDLMDGVANTSALARADASTLTGRQTHLAAESCSNMRLWGYDDWYLPAVQEATLLNRSQSDLQIIFGVIWTSTETDNDHAHSYNVGTGALNSYDDKWLNRTVQCVRTQPAAPAADCDGLSSPGETCSDGKIVYAGLSMSGGPLYTTTFPLAPVAWNADNASYTVRTNISDPTDGAQNTSALASRDASTQTGTQTHFAAATCAGMSFGGYNDWYLPAVQEAVILHRNKSDLPISPGVIWTSTETDDDHAHSYNVGTGSVTSYDDKWNNRNVQCVRSGPVPAPAADCNGLSTPGGACAGGYVVYAGHSLSGGALYTTSFPMAPVAWNQDNSSYTVRTNISDPMLGAQNTASLAASDATTITGRQTHLAAESCSSMRLGGFDDWYLPAAQEAVILHRNRGSLPVNSGKIWTSTETDDDHAHSYDIGSGGVSGYEAKWSNLQVQCVRSGPVPTPSADCDAVGAVGGTCGGGDIVYAGQSVSGGPLYTTSFPMGAVAWNQDNSSYTIRTNVSDPVLGAQNTASLAALDSTTITGRQTHLAAESCSNMRLRGYDDWYLPGAQELVTLHQNRASLPVKSGRVWTSTETDNDHAHSYDIGSGAVSGYEDKWNNLQVQCVRTGPVPTPPVDCDEVDTIGETCGGGDIVYAGEAIAGGALFMTPYRLASVAWNQDNSSYVTWSNVSDPVDGLTNTTRLGSLDATTITGNQTHLAAESCGNMRLWGYDDWYLPGVQELVTLYQNRGVLPVGSGSVWTSTETDNDHAHSYDPATGTLNAVQDKWSNIPLFCVRRDSETVGPVVSCDGARDVGDTCGSGDVVLAGNTPSGDVLFTTTFPLASVGWNQDNSSYTIQTNINDPMNGAANTTYLASRDAMTITGVQTHLAATTCEKMVYGGYSDWYLPASGEVDPLHMNRTSLPVGSGSIWTSTETDRDHAVSFDIGTGARTTLRDKWLNQSLLCVRKQSAPPPDPTVVFYDGFETLSGWNVIGSGSLTAATDQARSGTGSALKSSSDDPNGGYKLLSSPVDRNYEVEVWFRTSDLRAGGQADRIMVSDANGNGYGFNIGPTSQSFDIRTGYAATVVEGPSWSRPSNTWYRVVFRSIPDNTFRTTIYDEDGTELSTHAFTADTTHAGPFDRVAILGGQNYHVDDLTVTNFDEAVPYWDSTLNLFKSEGRDPRDIFGWAGIALNNNATTSRDASVTDSPIGGTPLRMSVTGPDPHIGTYHFGGVQNWNIAPAADGETWAVRVLAKASAPTTIQTFIFGTDAAGVWSTQPGTLGAIGHAVGTEWQEYTYLYTFANAGIEAMQLRLDGPDAGEAVDIWFDGLQVYKVEYARL